MRYLDEMFGYLEDKKILESQKNIGVYDGCFYNKYITHACFLAIDYPKEHTSMPFLLHLAFATPESDHKRVRLKLALFLQGSALYDIDAVRKRLGSWKDVLGLEMAIVNGKVRNMLI